MKIAMGFMAAKYLFVATEVGVFDVLARGPASLGELASSRSVFRTLSLSGLWTIGATEQHKYPSFFLKGIGSDCVES